MFHSRNDCQWLKWTVPSGNLPKAEPCVLIITHFPAHFVIVIYCYSNAENTGCNVARMMSVCLFSAGVVQRENTVFPFVLCFCI